MSHSAHNQTGSKRQHYDAETQAWADEMECWKRQRTSNDDDTPSATPQSLFSDEDDVTMMEETDAPLVTTTSNHQIVTPPMKHPPDTNNGNNWAMMNLKQFRQHQSPKKPTEARRDMVRLWNQKS